MMITGDLPQPKIVLEGTHLTRKTDLAFALAEHTDIVGRRRRRWHIPLISSEWETRSDQQPTKDEPGRSMIDYLPGDEDWVMACYENYVRLLELNRDYYWIVDRFHISTQSFQLQNQRKAVDLEWVDKRLANIGCVLVHLWRDPESFPAARKHRLTYSENPHRYDDLDVFIEEQEIIKSMVQASRMRSYTVNVSDGDVGRIAQEVLDWVKQIGAFYRCDQAETPIL